MLLCDMDDSECARDARLIINWVASRQSTHGVVDETLAGGLLRLRCCSHCFRRTAQTYPAKPIRLIVAFPAGGGSDVMGRVLVQRLAERVGQPFVVDNRPGAGGSIGTEAAVKAPADGYTLQLASTSEVSINRSLYTKLSYDPLKDLAPVGMVATTPMVLIVHPSMPVKDVKQLVALAKARPGQINYGSAGAGSTTHLAAELFKSATAIDIVHVPYKARRRRSPISPAVTCR